MSNDMDAASSYQVGGTHYKDMPIEPWDVMEAVLTPEEFRGYMKGCYIKYAMRAGHKVGEDVGKDVDKAFHYKHKLSEIIQK